MIKIVSGFGPVISAGGTVVAYGHSMGGYGAVKYARAFHASCVIAFGPQYSIDPADLDGRDPRYRSYFRAALHEGMRIAANDAVPNTYVFYDPFYAADAYNAERIAEVTGCTLIPVYCTGHDCIQPFAGTAVVKELIDRCLAADVPGLRALANRLRRAHWARKQHLAIHLLRRHPRWALRLYEKYCMDIGRERFADFAAALAANGLVQEAVAWSTKGFDEHTRDKGRLNAHVTLLLRAKKFEDAKRFARLGLTLDAASFMFTRRMSEACAGMNDLDEAIRWARASIENRQEDASGYNHLAGLLARSGRFIDAEAACKTALELEPSNQAFAERLRSILARTEDARVET